MTRINRFTNGSWGRKQISSTNREVSRMANIIKSVVFGGFSVDALQGRIDDSQSKLVITMDGSYNNGKVVELKRTVFLQMYPCGKSR